jgi:hypothetical protein
MTTSEFYDLARKTARIIHEKSWEENGILQVMLYGSTLHSSQPRDIDLLVIHNGQRLAPYFYYRKLISDAPPGENNARMPPLDFLMRLGYREGDCKENSVLARVEALVSPKNVNEIYDFNALNAGLLVNSNAVIAKGDPMDGSACDPWSLFATTSDVRKRAIDCCKETNFWHTILSQGKIYDPNSNDFSIQVRELYPDALGLFPSTSVALPTKNP